MNIIVTGGAGSGGSYLCEYIVNNHPEYQVHVLSRWHSTTSQNNLSAIKNKVVIHECDMSDLGSLCRILRAVKPVKIFNLASHANVRVCFDTPKAVINNNIDLMINLLEAIRLECPETILHHSSTSELYGRPIITPIKEDHPLNPANPYAVSKLTQEALCWAYHKTWGLKIVITRAFAYLNVRRREIFSTAFAMQIAQIEAGKLDILRHGNLHSTRTLMSVKDMVRAYWIASEKCEYGIPYNVGASDPIEVGEFMMKLISKAKCHIWTYEYPPLMRPIDMDMQICDSTKFNEHTGFKPEYTLDESIEWLLEECRRQVKDGK